MRKATIHNLGCKVNSYEAKAMEEMLEKEGYNLVSFEQFADVYIVNTCTVTNIADRKSRQMLQKARKRNPKAVVIAVGCYVQSVDAKLLFDAGVDIVIGNDNKHKLSELLREYWQEREGGHLKRKENEVDSKEKEVNSKKNEVESKRSEVKDISRSVAYEPLEITKPIRRTRGEIKIQDGCEQYCAYCIVPYVRGPIRSRSLTDIVREATNSAKNGCREVVLTGINLSSYGKDLQTGEDLLLVVQKIHEIDGIERIRLGSLEPRTISGGFVKALACLPKFCPHFHLSLQSGSDTVLRRMNRDYSTTVYNDKCRLIRDYFENPGITTDIIVGFPGETEDEYEETKAFVDRIGFSEIHVFSYSPRQGTEAAAMENQIPSQVKSKRSKELIALGEKKKREYRKMFVGKTVEVLIEDEITQEGQRRQVGYTKEYVKVAVKSEENLKNCIVSVNISDEAQII